jgi:hypothetical protein
MKKLSLKNATSMLSRKEMKAINGGGYNTNCCAVIMEFGHSWQDCGLSQQQAESAVCSYTDPYYHASYPGSYWTCTN